MIVQGVDGAWQAAIAAVDLLLWRRAAAAAGGWRANTP
jgi:hypothetical protein